MKLRSLFLFAFASAYASAVLAGSISGTVKCRGMRDNADAVVYIEKIPGQIFEPPAEPVVMDQRSLTFVPSVLPVVVGTKVDFLNSDAVSHNVFTPDECAGRFNLGSYPTRQRRQHVFTEPCQAVMLCNVHAEMEAHVIALENPFFSVTDKNGSFRIDGIPGGTYTVAVWHKRLKPTRQEITVPDEGTIELNLTIRR